MSLNGRFPTFTTDVSPQSIGGRGSVLVRGWGDESGCMRNNILISTFISLNIKHDNSLLFYERIFADDDQLDQSWEYFVTGSWLTSGV